MSGEITSEELTAKNNYKETSDEEIQKVLDLVKNAYSEIENLRRLHSSLEPHGAIKPSGKVAWFSSPEKWKEEGVDYSLSKKARRNLSNKGWVFFHCHPDSLENIASLSSTSDRVITPYGIYEAIFHHRGVTLLIAKKVYPFKKTEKIIEELREKAPLHADLYGDEYWAFDALVSQKFAIETMEIPREKLGK